MRRRPGLGAIQEQKAAREKFKDKSSAIQDNLVGELSKQLDEFKSKLEEFAQKHRDEIRRDSAFREHFQEMCATIGVDPLASSKGFWSELLGMGSFYYEISVQAVEIVLATSQVNGGVMPLGELRDRLNRAPNRRDKNLQSKVSCNDVLRAIKSLEVIGTSCGIVTPEGSKIEEYLVYCVPEELSLDNTKVIQYAASIASPVVSIEEINKGLNWETSRSVSVMEQLVREGMVWVDDGQPMQPRNYWFPGLFFSSNKILETGTGSGSSY